MCGFETLNFSLSSTNFSVGVVAHFRGRPRSLEKKIGLASVYPTLSVSIPSKLWVLNEMGELMEPARHFRIISQIMLILRHNWNRANGVPESFRYAVCASPLFQLCRRGGAPLCPWRAGSRSSPISFARFSSSLSQFHILPSFSRGFHPSHNVSSFDYPLGKTEKFGLPWVAQMTMN